jgi:hypothetical protein
MDQTGVVSDLQKSYGVFRGDRAQPELGCLFGVGNDDGTALEITEHFCLAT